MIIKFDWISFSFKRETFENETAGESIGAMDRALMALVGADVFDEFFVTEWRLDKGRAPYEASFHHPYGGVVQYFHTHLDHCLIEISGKGCEWMATNSKWDILLDRVKHRVTRIDIACDIKTNLNPLVFAQQRDHARFRAHSEFVSDSGTTAYVGSRTSNRYARVYRYNEPHERAHLLRIEHVLKRDDAKATLEFALSQGLQATAKRLGEGFGWRHPLWSVTAPTAAELSVYRPDRKEGKTLFWLADTIAPLLLRLEAEGILDIDQWIADHLTPKRK